MLYIHVIAWNLVNMCATYYAKRFMEIFFIFSVLPCLPFCWVFNLYWCWHNNGIRFVKWRIPFCSLAETTYYMTLTWSVSLILYTTITDTKCLEMWVANYVCIIFQNVTKELMAKDVWANVRTVSTTFVTDGWATVQEAVYLAGGATNAMKVGNRVSWIVYVY